MKTGRHLPLCNLEKRAGKNPATDLFQWLRNSPSASPRFSSPLVCAVPYLLVSMAPVAICLTITGALHCALIPVIAVFQWLRAPSALCATEQIYDTLRRLIVARFQWLSRHLPVRRRKSNLDGIMRCFSETVAICCLCATTAYHIAAERDSNGFNAQSPSASPCNWATRYGVKHPHKCREVSMKLQSAICPLLYRHKGTQG